MELFLPKIMKELLAARGPTDLEALAKVDQKDAPW